MARCQGRDLRAPAGKERVGTYQYGASAPENESRERGVDLADGSGVEDLDIEAQCGSGLGRVSHRRLRVRRVGRINQHGDARGSWNHLMQQRQSLSHQLAELDMESRDISTWPIEARDEADSHGVRA